MGKGQKRTSREAKKPKRPKVKLIAAASRFEVARAQSPPASAKKP